MKKDVFLRVMLLLALSNDTVLGLDWKEMGKILLTSTAIGAVSIFSIIKISSLVDSANSNSNIENNLSKISLEELKKSFNYELTDSQKKFIEMILKMNYSQSDSGFLQKYSEIFNYELCQGEGVVIGGQEPINGAWKEEEFFAQLNEKKIEEKMEEKVEEFFDDNNNEEKIKMEKEEVFNDVDSKKVNKKISLKPILLYGHPGVGKSTLAEQLSIGLVEQNEYDLGKSYFYSFHSSLVKSKWYGDSIKEFKRIINYIRLASKKNNNLHVLCIDGFDSFFANYDNSQGHNVNIEIEYKSMIIELKSFLKEIEKNNLPILCIAISSHDIKQLNNEILSYFHIFEVKPQLSNEKKEVAMNCARYPSFFDANKLFLSTGEIDSIVEKSVTFGDIKKLTDSIIAIKKTLIEEIDSMKKEDSKLEPSLIKSLKSENSKLVNRCIDNFIPTNTGEKYLVKRAF